MIQSLGWIMKDNQINANKGLLEAKSIAERYPDVPFSNTILKTVDQYYKEVNVAYEKTLALARPHFLKIDSLDKEAHKIEAQQKVIDLFESAFTQHPDNQEIQTFLSSAYGSQAWYQLFGKQFKEAAQSAVRGLEIDATQEWIHTNLALALLLQGKYKKAEAIYLQYKDEAFNEETNFKAVFFEDLETLEQEGIYHEDFEQIRRVLKE